MIKKELIDYVESNLNIKKRDLIEKDLILHRLLFHLTRDSKFLEKYVFKGGTCLTKCYLGYYRFSEDLDFSWINQNRFINKTEKQIRKELSEEIKFFADLLEEISKLIGLDFKADKKDSKFIEFGGSNKFVTFKLWHDSAELRNKQFIKVQINFVEKFAYKIKKGSATNLLKNIDKKDFSFLFDEDVDLVQDIKLNVYDLREILIEKIRAIVTRRGVKARDYIDIYVIEKSLKIRVESLEKKILDKISFMLKYEKYLDNLRKKSEQKQGFVLGDEEGLLLEPLDKDFYEFVKRIDLFIDRIIDFSVKTR